MDVNQFQPNSFSEPTNYTPLPTKKSSSSSFNKILLVAICLLTFILVVLVGFLILRKQQLQMGKFENPAPTTIISPPQESSASVSPSPTLSPEEDDEKELQSVEVGTDEADFKDIQTDVSGL